MHSRPNEADERKLIEQFLNDVSRIEPIKGREEYLPLTRRIERGRALLLLAERSFELTFPRVQGALRRNLMKFNQQCRIQGGQPMIPSEFVKQIEEFLDRPQIDTPLALAQCIGSFRSEDSAARKSHEKLGWRCFYLLALFPSEIRADALTCQPSEAILKHFRLVVREWQQSRSRLIEGTLRYILRIAPSYLGRGLSYLDLVQEGFFGLRHAVDRFVEFEGAHFQQYASQWIQQRIMRAIADQTRLIRLPAHMVEKLTVLKRLEREYENDLVFNPHARDQEIIKRLGLSAEDEIENKTGKAAAKLKRLRSADARHYSIDLDAFAEFLVDENSFEAQIELELLNRAIHEWLERLLEREREIVLMRAGLRDGQAKTLEEIARIYGLTRERIRQIEAKAHKRMVQKPSKYAFRGAAPETDHRIEAAVNQLHRPLFDILDALDMRATLQTDAHRRERRWIEERIVKRVMRGKRKMMGRRKQGQMSRVDLFAQILTEANHPLHYGEIHRRALALLPPERHFTKEVAYAALFYNNRFRLLGEGIFSLVTWRNGAQTTPDGYVLTHCPPPPLPVNAAPGAFFESILVARQLVQTHPNITVMRFFEELSESGRVSSAPQDAFDAWYAAGLHDYIDFERQAREMMRLSIPADWGLADVRTHCVNQLCRRLLKMPELLAALERLATADVPTLQRVLFGDASAGYDVPFRLTMLAAFEAVRADGSQWRITEVGRAALQANPLQQPLDLSALETPEPEASETDDWDDHLAIFTL
jgi:RNA polymerase sigma factor (sigma-70 family)